MACKFLCSEFEASAVSIMMYNGKTNTLKCEGTYIKFEEGYFILEQKESKKYIHILQNLLLYDFIDEYFEKYNHFSQLITQQRKFINLTSTNITDLERIYHSRKSWKTIYKKIKETFTKEDYKLDKNSISGDFYIKSFNTHEADEKYYNINLNDIDNNKKVFENTISKDLKITLSKFNEYIAFPLYSENRLYGWLRFIFSNKKKYTDKELSLKYSSKILSLNIEKKYFVDAHKQLNLGLLNKKYIPKSEKEFVKVSCNLFTKVINCENAVFLQFKRESKKIIPTIFNDSFEKNDDLLKICNGINWESILSYLFKENSQLLSIYINKIQNTYEISNFYEEVHSNNIKAYYNATEDLAELNLPKEFTYLLDDKRKHISIIPVHNLRNTFILLMNNNFRPFMQKDIEILLIGSEMIGTGLENINHQARTHVVDLFQEEIDAFFTDSRNSEEKTHLIYDAFIKIISKYLSKIDLFHDYIIWDYITESLPEKKDERKYLRLKNTSLDIVQKEVYIESIDEEHIKSKVKQLGDKNSDVYNISINNHTIKYDTQYGFISLFTKSNIWNHGFNEDEEKFLLFLGRQLNIAWMKAMNTIVKILQNRIDKFSLKKDLYINKVASLISNNFSSDLCFLFAYVKRETETLKLIGQNVTNLDLEYYLDKDKHLLTSKSFTLGKDIRVHGYNKIRDFADEFRLKTIEESYNQSKKIGNQIINQWLSLVISISKDKKGIIKLFRFTEKKKGMAGSKPFSNFENNLLKRVQKHTYNLIAQKEITTLEIENELEKERERTENMRIVSHQVISPLGALIQHCRNLQIGMYSEEETPEKIFHLNILAKQAAIYARSYMTLIELEKGTQKIEKTVVDNFDKYLRPIVIDYQPILNKKGLKIFLQTTSINDNLDVEIDANLFKHAFFNLVDNAVKYSFSIRQRALKKEFIVFPKNKTDIENILVDVEELNDAVSLRVSNLGIPIYPIEKNRIFERNFRGKSAEKSAANGSGIGLYLAKKIINLHGGDISLEEGKNEFQTIFKIILPK